MKKEGNIHANTFEKFGHSFRNVKQFIVTCNDQLQSLRVNLGKIFVQNWTLIGVFYFPIILMSALRVLWVNLTNFFIIKINGAQ